MIPVTLYRQNRKTLAMRLTPDGVEVRIPVQLDPAGPQVQRFIETGLAKLPPPPSEPAAPRTRAALYTRVQQWADGLDLHPARVQIRPMRHKWGSLSTRGTLTLADDLLTLPDDLVDYVIVHELLHLRFPNHRRGFRASLTAVLPDHHTRAHRLAAHVLTPRDRQPRNPPREFNVDLNHKIA